MQQVLLLLVILATASALNMRVFNHGKLYVVAGVGKFGKFNEENEKTNLLSSFEVSQANEPKITDIFKETYEYVSKQDCSAKKGCTVAEVKIKTFQLVGAGKGDDPDKWEDDPEKNTLKITYGSVFKGKSKDGEITIHGSKFVGAEGTAFSKYPFKTLAKTLVAANVDAKANVDTNGILASVSALLTAELEVELAKLDGVGLDATAEAGVDLSIAFKISYAEKTIKIGTKVFAGAEAKVKLRLRWVVFSAHSFAGVGVNAQIEVGGGEMGVELGGALVLGGGVGVRICYSQIKEDIVYIAVRGTNVLKTVTKEKIKKKMYALISKNTYKKWKIKVQNIGRGDESNLAAIMPKDEDKGAAAVPPESPPSPIASPKGKEEKGKGVEPIKGNGKKREDETMLAEHMQLIQHLESKS